jgi:hypothetical protein
MMRAAPPELRKVRNISIGVAETFLVKCGGAPIAAEEVATIPAGKAYFLVLVVDACLLPR